MQHKDTELEMKIDRALSKENILHNFPRKEIIKNSTFYFVHLPMQDSGKHEAAKRILIGLGLTFLGEEERQESTNAYQRDTEHTYYI